MADLNAVRYPAWAAVVQARERAGLTVAELSAQSSSSTERIDAIETARVVPSTAELFELMEACGLELRLVIAGA